MLEQFNFRWRVKDHCVLSRADLLWSTVFLISASHISIASQQRAVVTPVANDRCCCLKATLHSWTWICVNPPKWPPAFFFFYNFSSGFLFVFFNPAFSFSSISPQLLFTVIFTTQPHNQWTSHNPKKIVPSLFYETANPHRVITKVSAWLTKAMYWSSHLKILFS